MGSRRICHTDRALPSIRSITGYLHAATDERDMPSRKWFLQRRTSIRAREMKS
eukprot:SAG31_NODE_17766_length_658_cov_1.842576_1_plen_52_part_01